MPEIIIYQAPEALEMPLPEYIGKRESPSILFSNVAKILAIVGAFLILISYGSSLFYWALSGLSKGLASIELSKKEVQLLSVDKPAEIDTKYLPAFDPTLPKEARLEISSIGVNTSLQEATLDNYEEALKKGVWRVSDFGSPDAYGTPVILAAHRFGYLAWSNLYRRQNSFFNLPKVKVGDTITVVWRQRKYTYEVYSTTKDTEIKDYTADLILYTCEALTGPDRVFVYARLLKV